MAVIIVKMKETMPSYVLRSNNIYFLPHAAAQTKTGSVNTSLEFALFIYDAFGVTDMIAKKRDIVNGFETVGGFFAFGGGFAPFQSVTAARRATKYTCKGRGPWRDVPAGGALFGRLPTKGNFVFPSCLPRTYNSICERGASRNKPHTRALRLTKHNRIGQMTTTTPPSLRTLRLTE